MRAAAAAAWCGLFLLWAIGPQGLAWADARDPDQPRAETAAAAPGDAPRVLRGTGMPPRPAPVAAMAPARWQVVAGDELWLVDPAAGDVVACFLRNTARVGVRVVRCHAGTLPRLVAD